MSESIRDLLLEIVEAIRDNTAALRELKSSKGLVVTQEVQPFTKKPKYEWFEVSDGGKKVRKCNNSGCNLYLRWNDEKNTYMHGIYDPNTKTWGYIADKCEHYQG